MLAEEDILYVATRAQWYFDVLYPQTVANGDWTVMTGEGLNDLNLVINRYAAQPDLRVRVDVGRMTSSAPSVRGITITAFALALWFRRHLISRRFSLKIWR